MSFSIIKDENLQESLKTIFIVFYVIKLFEYNTTYHITTPKLKCIGLNNHVRNVILTCVIFWLVLKYNAVF